MALTTQDGTKIGQTIVEDVNANVVDPSSTAVRQISPEAAILFNKAIIAKPLMVPEVCSVKVKNLEYRYRWVNRDGMGGRVYMQRRAQGFLNATDKDVEVMGGDVQSKDGEIRAGDLILMKIRADLYDSAIKANMVRARVLGNARGLYQEGGSQDVMSDDAPNRRTVAADPGNRTKLAAAFIPSEAETNRMVDDSIRSGRAEASREAVEELRSHKGEKK